jgi:hypothetical protein
MAIDLQAPGESGANFEDIKQYLGVGAVNVLWFSGVDPTGVADSTTGIQAAFDAAWDTNTKGWGTVYFPPGEYLVTDTIVVSPTALGEGLIAAGVKVLGSGIYSTVILCSMAKPIFKFGSSEVVAFGSEDGSSGSATSVRVQCSGMTLINNSTNAASGCITLRGGNQCQFDNLHINNLGGTGIRSYNECYSITYLNCQFEGGETIGVFANESVGLKFYNHHTIIGCDFSKYWIGVHGGGTQLAMVSTRCETCEAALLLGYKPWLSGAPSEDALQYFSIDGGSFESNYTSMDLRVTQGKISNISCHGASNGSQQLVQGIICYGGGNVTFENINCNPTVTSPATQAYTGTGFSCYGVSSPIDLINCTINNTGGTAFTFASNERFVRRIVGGNIPTPRTNVNQGAGSGKSTGVTLNNYRVQVTMDAEEQTDGELDSFTLTNDKISADSKISVSHESGGTAGAYHVQVNGVASGSCVVSVRNISGGTLSEAIVLWVDVDV